MNLSECYLEFSDAVHSAVINAECNAPMTLDVAKCIYLIGNGGSCAVASHISNDLVKARGRAAYALTDASILTCLANDYGYENALREAIHRYISKDDALICISSSGRSENIIRAANHAQSLGADVVTFTGFDWDNPLRMIGDCNYWVPSYNYGVVECAHLVLLHSMVNPGEIDAAKGEG